MGAWGGGEHEPSLVAAVADGPQLDLLLGPAALVDIPLPTADGHAAVLLQAGRAAEQGAVFEPAATQLQQFGELLLDVVDDRVGSCRGLSQLGGVMNPGQVLGVGDDEHLKTPGPRGQL